MAKLINGQRMIAKISRNEPIFFVFITSLRFVYFYELTQNKYSLSDRTLVKKKNDLHSPKKYLSK